MGAMAGGGLDAEVIDLELDDELFDDAPEDSPAVVERSAPRTGHGVGNHDDVLRVSVSGISLDMGDGSRGSTPTEAALAARAKAVEARRAAATIGDGGGSGEVTGSMLGAADDDDSSEDELEVFDATPDAKSPASNAKTSDLTAQKDVFGEDDIELEVGDAAVAAGHPAKKLSSGDDAIDTIDAISAAHAAAAASQKSVEQLAEKFVDKFDLEIDGEGTSLETGSSATAGAVDDEFEDEFGYAFEGKARDGRTHKHEFKAKPMPQNLVTNVKSMAMDALAEEDEEEEEEDEEVDDEEGEMAAEVAAFEAATEAVRDKAEMAELKPEDTAAAAVAAAAAARARREAAAGEKETANPMNVKSSPGKPSPAAASVTVAAATADEWDQVNAVRAKEEETALPGVGGGVVQLLSPVTYLEAKRYFTKLDISPFRHELHVEDEPSGCCACLALKLSADIAKDRELMFGMAKIKLDDDDNMHLRVLHTIYMRLMGGARAMPRYGSHWEDVGFQGSDPATDLRGCGMLGLLQLLFLINHSYTNASAIHRLSRDAIQEFPMAPLGINLTHIALKAARKGLLTAEANKLGSMWKAADNFYCGAFYEFYLRWKSGGKTIVDSGHVKRELEDFLLTPKGVRHALDLSENARLGQPGSTQSGAGAKKGSSKLEFQDF